MPQSLRSVAWIDAGGRTRQTITRTSTTASAIMSTLQGHSNAGVLEWFEGPDNQLFGTGVNATFPDVADAAILTFTTAIGTLVTLTLPAPKLAIFMADGATVNPSAIADIIAAALANLVDGAGNPVTAYVAGIRRNLRGTGA